jgi:DNA-binding winged helix-turn-helix (wHTH) protein/HAMP domain-containing protein
MAGWIFLMVIAISAVAILLARALLAPIGKLQSAARDIASGNLSEPIMLGHSDELGDIANHLETIRARLREALEPVSAEDKPMVCGEIALDPRTHRVSVDGTPVKLSATEFNLVQYLMINRDAVVSASQIITNVWGYAADEDDDVVRMTISRLRKKIERDPAHPAALVTIPGAGYMLKSKA